MTEIKKQLEITNNWDFEHDEKYKYFWLYCVIFSLILKVLKIDFHILPDLNYHISTYCYN